MFLEGAPRVTMSENDIMDLHEARPGCERGIIFGPKWLL